MSISLQKNTDSLPLFKKYLRNIEVYFEYGCGISTYLASNVDNIKTIYIVESDKEWINCIKQNIKKNNIVYIYNEMDTIPKTWGHPGKNATDIQKINYSSHMKNLSREAQTAIDLVFIDGRFRVACCLKSFDIIKDECLIVFDDFLNRPQYHIILNYFDMVEKCSNNRTVMIKKKKGVCVPHELIKKYELIAD